MFLKLADVLQFDGRLEEEYILRIIKTHSSWMMRNLIKWRSSKRKHLGEKAVVC